MAKVNIKLRLDALHAWMRQNGFPKKKKEVTHNEFEGPIKVGKQR